MTRLPSVSSDEVIQALRKVGFISAPKRRKGRHTALYRTDEAGRKRLLSSRNEKTFLRGTLSAILEQAGITRAEFLQLL
jgi:predicted RNA binding protein YcfA (HicA-like mRNA interferase family)